MKKTLTALGGTAVLVLALGACSSSASDSSSPSSTPSSSAVASSDVTSAADTQAAEQAVNRFFQDLRDDNTADLEALLSPAFQVTRANGSTANKAEYLANLPRVDNYVISDVSATRNGDVMVVKYNVTTTETIDGKPYSGNPTGRMSVFQWDGSSWQLVAHANFNSPVTVSPGS